MSDGETVWLGGIIKLGHFLLLQVLSITIAITTPSELGLDSN